MCVRKATCEYVNVSKGVLVHGCASVGKHVVECIRERATVSVCVILQECKNLSIRRVYVPV